MGGGEDGCSGEGGASEQSAIFGLWELSQQLSHPHCHCSLIPHKDLVISLQPLHQFIRLECHIVGIMYLYAMI